MYRKIAHKSNYHVGRRGEKVKKIVVHYTANKNDTALANANHFQKPKLNASAHYFIDDKDVVMSVEERDTAFHSGKMSMNRQSIGVEMCTKHDGKNYYISNDTQKNTQDLIRYLCKKYNLKPDKDVIRHYDVTGKNCPAPFVGEKNLKKWQEFKEEIEMEKLKIKLQNKVTEKTIEKEVINIGGFNYVKVRDVAEVLDIPIDFDNNTKTVLFN